MIFSVAQFSKLCRLEETKIYQNEKRKWHECYLNHTRSRKFVKICLETPSLHRLCLIQGRISIYKFVVPGVFLDVDFGPTRFESKINPRFRTNLGFVFISLKLKKEFLFLTNFHHNCVVIFVPLNIKPISLSRNTVARSVTGIRSMAPVQNRARLEDI